LNPSFIDKQSTDRIIDNIDNWNQEISMKEGQVPPHLLLKIWRVSTYYFGKQGSSLFRMAIVEITPNKDIEIIANNYMVVPDQLIEAKIFRVLKDNQYLMPVLEQLQNYLGSIPLRLQRFFI
jgi:hypothetical protein